MRLRIMLINTTSMRKPILYPKDHFYQKKIQKRVIPKKRISEAIRNTFSFHFQTRTTVH